MATVSEVTSQPLSGYTHIDALVESLPAWNYLTRATPTIYYSFSTASATEGSGDVSNIASFNATQIAAARGIMSHVSQLTGIAFAETGDGNAADIHFASGDILTGTFVAGITSTRASYSYDIATNVIVSYSADAWVYLDSNEWWGENAAPTAGSPGYETLLHEVGHALGLKHPFEGTPTLPVAQDNSSYTVMSYDSSGGPYSTFNPYDVAALKWLYGGDGLGGALGVGTPGKYLMGTAGSDALSGGTGNDVLEGLAGNDTLAGGPGNDRLDGGPGSDWADYSGSPNGWTVNIAPGSWTLFDGSTDTFVSIENLRGTAYADVLIGDGQSNQIEGGVGNDWIYGASGADILYGGDGSDVLYGDLFAGESGADYLDGGPGNDVLIGGELADFLYGGDGDDWIYGGNGDDTDVHGGAGNDVRYGDLFVGEAGDDILIGGAGNDWMVGDVGNDWLYGSDGDDTLEGGDGNDVLYGDLFASEAGNDFLIGGTGNDILVGGVGNDTLQGGEGNDLLYGMDGNDVLYGGAGADRFVYWTATEALAGGDFIKDFSGAGAQGDRIDASIALDALGYTGSTPFTGGWLALAQVGANAQLWIDLDGPGSTYGYGTLITFEGVSTAQISTASDFIV
ncbi:MAG: hypothetical protein HY778_17655 [Betaproteobacteria bacterium]|nr:hypothetical protein [Betaproteobacteria bacterium]